MLWGARGERGDWGERGVRAMGGMVEYVAFGCGRAGRVEVELDLDVDGAVVEDVRDGDVLEASFGVVVRWVTRAEMTARMMALVVVSKMQM